MNSAFFTITFTIFTFLTLVAAAPVDLSKRDVFVPPVLTPNRKSVWKVRSIQTVTWNVTNPPKSITNKQASVVLVKDGLLQNLDDPLALVDVMTGMARITVPNVKAGRNYQMLVFGDSGNTGEFFTITN